MSRLAAVLLAVTTIACAPRIVDAPGLVAATGSLCARDHAAHIIYLDPEQIEAAEQLAPGTRAWCIAHEQAHLDLDGTGITFGPGLVGLERLAQCGAELQLGHGPPYPADLAAGYWDCPASALAHLRTALGKP